MDQIIRFKKFLTNAASVIRYAVGVLIGTVYIIYDMFFLKTNVATHAATMQLEDSDTVYSVGRELATANSNYLFWLAIALIMYCTYKISKIKT